MNMSKKEEAVARGETQRDLLRALPLPKEIEATLSRLGNWSHEYGASLCPNGRPDMFGEGMRAAKEQIASILAGARISREEE